MYKKYVGMLAVLTSRKTFHKLRPEGPISLTLLYKLILEKWIKMKLALVTFKVKNIYVYRLNEITK